MLMKGADNIIKQRLSKDQQQRYLPGIDDYLNNFSR